MTIQEYKELSRQRRFKKFIFPSGLEIEIEIPTTKEFLDEIMKSEDLKTNEIYDLFLKLIEKKFPDGLLIEDLLPEDFAYFMGEINNFFSPLSTIKLKSS